MTWEWIDTAVELIVYGALVVLAMFVVAIISDTVQSKR